MRRLLLAALGAAGSMLIDLPALAQLSNTTSTFSGQVAATCEFNNLAENFLLSYRGDANYLDSRLQNFELSTNLSGVRISVDRVVVLSEPPPYASSIQARIMVDHPTSGYSFISDKNIAGSRGFNLSASKLFTIQMAVFTESLVEGKYELPSGNYSYRTTIYCLQ